MSVINVQCIDQILTFTNMPVISSGDENVDKINFTFSSEWDGYAVTCVFYKQKGEYYYGLVDANGNVNIPSEILSRNGIINFGIVGINGNNKLTSSILKYRIVEGAYTQVEASKDIYNQILNELKDTVFVKDVEIIESPLVADADTLQGYPASDFIKANSNGKIVSSQLDTSSDAYKIKLINLSEEVQSAMAGTAPVISSVADASLTASKYANMSITAPKLNESALNLCDLISGLNKSKDYLVCPQTILPAVLSNATLESGTTKVTISSGGYYNKPFYNTADTPWHLYSEGDVINLIVKSSVDDSTLANLINFRYLLSTTTNNYATYLGNGYFGLLNHKLTATTANCTAQLFIDLRNYSSSVTFEVYMAKNGIPLIETNEDVDQATGLMLFKDPYFKNSSPFDVVRNPNSKIARANNADFGAVYTITRNASATGLGTQIKVDGYKLSVGDKVRFKVVSSDNTVSSYESLTTIQNWATFIRIIQYNSSNAEIERKMLPIVKGTQYLDAIVLNNADKITFDFMVYGGSSTGSIKLKEFNVINLSVNKQVDVYEKENKTLFVSPTGDDNNSGFRHDQALATFQEAINRGAETIYAKRGKYYNQTIVYNGADKQKLSIQPFETNTYSVNLPDRPLIEIINATIFNADDLTADGNLLKASFEGNTRFNNVFIDKTSAPETTGTWSSYNAGLWQLHENIADDIKLKPVLSKALCEAETGTFYWDGTYIYINPKTNLTYTSFAIHDDNDYIINLGNIREVRLNDVSVKFGYNNTINIVNCMNVEMHNCHSSYTMLDHGIRLDWSNGNLYNCTSTKARVDGFNIHYYGATNFYNCSGCYNEDDGISHHEGCIGSVVGGEWHHNGKGGISPAAGAQINVSNVYSHDNKYGLYYVASSSQVTGRQCITSGNFLKNNTSAGIIVDYYNITSINDKYTGNANRTSVLSNGTMTEY